MENEDKNSVYPHFWSTQKITFISPKIKTFWLIYFYNIKKSISKNKTILSLKIASTAPLFHIHFNIFSSFVIQFLRSNFEIFTIFFRFFFKKNLCFFTKIRKINYTSKNSHFFTFLVFRWFLKQLALKKKILQIELWSTW